MDPAPANESPPQVEPVGTSRPSPAKLVFAGLLTIALLPVNAQFIIQSETVHYAGFPTTISLFYNAVFVLAVLALINIPLRRIAPRAVLGPAEMSIVYVGLCAASTFAAHDAVQVLVPAMAHGYRYAAPENNWQTLILDHIPQWLTVSDKASLKILYEGGGKVTDPAVYKPWIQPSLWWIAFTLAFHGGTFALVSLFRRRWIESERLSFPIIHLPVELMRGRSLFFRDPLLWVFLFIALAIDIVNGLHVLHPTWPQIPTRGEALPAFNLGGQITDRPWDALGFTPLSFYPIVIGMGLLLPSELALSCWAWFWFWRLLQVVVRALGMEVVPEFPYREYQALGGYIGIAAVAIFLSRRYVGEVFRGIVGVGPALPQTREALSYRTAALGFVAAFAFLVWFSVHAGMSFLYALAFFAIYFAIAFAVSRVRAEMGLPAHDIHFSGPSDVLPKLWGTRNLSVETRIVSRIYFWFNRAYRNHQGPHHIEALKLAELTGLKPRAMTLTVGLMTVLGCFVAFWAILSAYAYFGATAKTKGTPFGFGSQLYGLMNTDLTDPRPANLGMGAATLIGIVFMVVCLALKMRMPWFPIHPSGYAVSASWTMQFMWCPLLIAWAIKGLVGRYAGGDAHRRLIAIAFGLILGDMAGGVWWAAYGIHTKQQIYSIFQ